MLLALMQCEEHLTLSALLRQVAGVGQRIDGLSRFFAAAPWQMEKSRSGGGATTLRLSTPQMVDCLWVQLTKRSPVGEGLSAKTPLFPEGTHAATTRLQ